MTLTGSSIKKGIKMYEKRLLIKNREIFLYSIWEGEILVKLIKRVYLMLFDKCLGVNNQEMGKIFF